MPLTDTALDAGAAWTALRSADAAGEVIARFDAAVYLRLDGAVVALVSPAVDRGPLHARVTSLPASATGTPARIRDGALLLGGRRFAIPAQAWLPEPVGDALTGAGLLRELVQHSPELGLDHAGTSVAEVAERLLSEGLDGACRWLVGRGRGLTPAGDDVAAGLLLTHALTGETDRAHLLSIAESARTHEISRAFLRWAALGQGIEPAHRLVDACAATDRQSAQEALSRLAGVGHTSGMDVAAGIAAGLSALAAARDARSDHPQTDR